MNVTGIIRCKCGWKGIAESTLFKTDGKCPKCEKMIDSSYGK